MDILKLLSDEGVSDRLISKIEDFRRTYSGSNIDQKRIPQPMYNYYGKEVWEEAISTILAGENLLLVGPKATGKNVLAQGLAAAFARPEWDISFYINTDAASLIGTDTFKNGEVQLRQGPILEAATQGGFGVLDEINMAKNESLAVLHATLDFRRIIDVPGDERISLHPATRFIGTMNYGYAGTRELNEALCSRFALLQMPVIGQEELTKLFLHTFPDMNPDIRDQFEALFFDLEKKAEHADISEKAVDLRGLLDACRMIRRGLTSGEALEMTITDKTFDTYERKLVHDVIAARIPEDLTAKEVFPNS